MDVDDHGATYDPTETEPHSPPRAGPCSAEVLAQQLADFARELQSAETAQDVLDLAIATAVALVPGADQGSISLVRARRQVTSAASTGPAGRHLDDLQTELGQGPCLDAAFTQRATRVHDLATEERWPRLAARAGEIGLASMLCLQLYVRGNHLGALNLLGAQPGAFTDTSEHVGLLLAAHAAVAVADAIKQENMSQGLAHRDVIGQAKGILMERHKLTADQAFAVLSQVSQHTNRKLYDIALDLTASGELPNPPPSRPQNTSPRASPGRPSPGRTDGGLHAKQPHQ